MFRLPNEANDWFKRIKANSINTPLFIEEWDLYYLCLLYGITEGEVEVKNQGGTKDMAKGFSKRYSASKFSLLTMLMMAHAQRLKIDLTDKKELQKVLKTFIDTDHESGLSKTAIDKMNQYAAAGYLLLSDKVPVMQNSSLAISRIYKDLNKKMESFAKKFK